MNIYGELDDKNIKFSHTQKTSKYILFFIFTILKKWRIWQKCILKFLSSYSFLQHRFMKISETNSPALFDWSIIGWTILRLALINLKQKHIVRGAVRSRQNRAPANAHWHRKWLGFLSTDCLYFRCRHTAFHKHDYVVNGQRGKRPCYTPECVHLQCCTVFIWCCSVH